MKIEKDENSNEFGKLFLELYMSRKLKIIWSRNGCSLKFDDDVNFDDFDKKDFVKYSFDIIYIIKNILLNKPIDNVTENDLLVANEIAKSEEKFIDDIILKGSTLIDTYSKSEYEIITHYNKSTDKMLKSALVKIYYENDEDEKNINVEFTKNDLLELSLQINELISKFD